MNQGMLFSLGWTLEVTFFPISAAVFCLHLFYSKWLWSHRFKNQNTAAILEKLNGHAVRTPVNNSHMLRPLNNN